MHLFRKFELGEKDQKVAELHKSLQIKDLGELLETLNLPFFCPYLFWVTLSLAQEAPK